MESKLQGADQIMGEGGGVGVSTPEQTFSLT